MLLVDQRRRIFNSGSPTPLLWTPNSNPANRVFSRAVGGVYCDVNGVYQNSAGVERIHYLGDLVTNGTLIEPSRTNSCLWSRDLTNAVWVKTGTGTVTLTATGLDGTANSASILTDSDAAAGYKVEQSWAIANDNATHCVSVYFRKDAVTTRFPRIALQLTGGVTPVRRDCQINTQTGAVSAAMNGAGTGTHRVIDGGLWWIVEITLTNNTTGNVTLLLSILPADGSVLGVTDVTVQGNATVGQVNTELNSLQCTTPIYTTAATVTRSVDGLHFTPFGLAIYPVTIYAKVIPLGIDAGNVRVVQVGDNVAGNAIMINANGQAGAFQAGTKDSVSFKNSVASAPTSLGSILELRGFWDVNLVAQMGMSVNAAAEVVTGAGATPNAISAYAPDVLAIGSVSTAHSTPMNALFQSLKVLYGTKTMSEMRAA